MNVRRLAIFALCVLAPLFASCMNASNKSQATADAGSSSGTDSNGAGYGGGEDPSITAARNAHSDALLNLKYGFEPERLVASECNTLLYIFDADLCGDIGRSSKTQRESLAVFQSRFTEDLLAMNNEGPSQTKISLTSASLTQPLDKGGSMEVGALVHPLGPQGSIRLNELTWRSLSRLGQLSLLVHERTHTLQDPNTRETFGDFGSYFGFPTVAQGNAEGSGRRAWKTLGAMLSNYTAFTLMRTPVIFPPSANACNRQYTGRRFNQAPYYSSDQATGQYSPKVTEALDANPNGNFTISMWARLDIELVNSTQPSVKMLFSNLDHTWGSLTGVQLTLRNDGTGYYFASHVGAWSGVKNQEAPGEYQRQLNSGIRVPDDRYHHYVLTRLNGRVSHFVDGIEGRHYDHLTGGVSNTHGYLGTIPQSGLVGQYPQPNPRASAFRGNIALMEMYPNRGLSLAEISTLYDCGGPDRQSIVEPPSLISSLSQPLDGAGVSGDVPLTALPVTQAVINRVEFYVDGDIVGQDASPPYSILWDSRTALPGAHFVIAKVYTADGSTGISPQAGITVSGNVPAVPTSLEADPYSSTEIDLTWDDVVNATGIRIERSTDNVNFAPLADQSSDQSYYWDTSVSSGTTYYYKVRAYNAVGDSAPASVSATTP